MSPQRHKCPLRDFYKKNHINGRYNWLKSIHLQINTKCTGCKMMSQYSVIEAHTTAVPSTSTSHEGKSSNIPVYKKKIALVLQVAWNEVCLCHLWISLWKGQLEEAGERKYFLNHPECYCQAYCSVLSDRKSNISDSKRSSYIILQLMYVPNDRLRFKYLALK